VTKADVLIHGDAIDAKFPQGNGCIAQEINALEDALADHRLHHVELKLTSFGRHGDRDIVAHHLEAHLVHHFRDDRVNLGRHDAGASLSLGQVDLVQASAWSGGKQSKIV